MYDNVGTILCGNCGPFKHKKLELLEFLCLLGFLGSYCYLTFLCRMSTYKHKSGAQKRKEQEEAEGKRKKLPKITAFFNSLSTATASTSLTTSNESKL